MKRLYVLIGFSVLLGISILSVRSPVARTPADLEPTSQREPGVSSAAIAQGAHASGTGTGSLGTSFTQGESRAAVAGQTLRENDSVSTLLPPLPRWSPGQSSPEVVAGIAQAIAQKYRRFFETHRLPEATQQQILAVVTEETVRYTDDAAAGRSLRELNETYVRCREKAEAALADLLSPEELAAIREYRRTLPYRAIVDDMVTRSAAAGDPVSPETADAVATALANARISMPTGTSRYTRTQYDTLTSRDPLGLEMASRLLSERQLGFLKQSLGARIRHD